MAVATVQTAESNVDAYLNKISAEETHVDACVRLMEAEGK